MSKRLAWFPVLLAMVVVAAMAPVAGADLSRTDPNDVEHKLDVRLSAAFLDRFPGQDRIAISAEFYERIPQRLGPRVKVQYDAFGSPDADFALLFRFAEVEGEPDLRCRLVRLADREVVHSRKGDADHRSLLCYMRRPGSWGEHGPVRWRLRAILPGRGDDLAPNSDWYPHA